VVSLQEPLQPPSSLRVPWLSCRHHRRHGCCKWSSSAIGGGGVAHQAEAQHTGEEAQLAREVAQPREGGWGWQTPRVLE
jgi:hypothetical protein